VDLDYFTTVGIPIAAGRAFGAADVVGSEPVAIVSERYARMIWADTSPIGKRISINRYRINTATIVGVAREALTMGVREQSDEPLPVLYLPLRQHPSTLDLTVLVRAEDDARPLAPALRAAIARLDPNLPLMHVQTLAAYREAATAESRLGSTLLAIFGSLALLLATVGTYAVIAFSISQRRREIGIRVALGAARPQIVGLFLREGLRLSIAGILIGVALSAAAAQTLASLFLGLSVADAIPVATVCLLLATAAMGASWIPARRAAAVDPMDALRSD
jgi:hypothetical protein